MPRGSEIDVGKRFDEQADLYNGDKRYPVRNEVREAAAEIIRGLRPARVLDGGCGTGQLLIDIAPHIKVGVGFDVSKRCLERAQRDAALAEGSEFKFVYAGFSDMPTHRCLAGLAPFDVICCTYSMHHLPACEKRVVIREFAHLLNPGGSLVIGDLMFFEEPEVHRGEYGRAGYDPDHDLPETSESLGMMMHEAGLDISVPGCIHPLAGIMVGRSMS